MEKYNLVEFSINFAPQAITSHFHIYLDTEDYYHVEFKRLESKYSANLLYLQKFSNIPNLIMMTALTSTNEEAAKLHMQLQDEEFERLEHNIFFNGYFFETWRDKLYIEKLTN
jgi:hypothetical protein